MGWPYEFTTLSAEERHLRRLALDNYALIAHYSAFAPALIVLLITFTRRSLAALTGRLYGTSGSDRGRYAQVPGSPLAKAQRSGALGGLAAHWRRVAWWLGDDVVLGGVSWGQRDEWVVGLAWMSWLLVLSFLGTGKDYLHLTKRFGIIAVSQLPIQYLLSLKALNPYAWAFNSSHEHINRYHRVLGRLIYALLAAHVILYNIFLFLSGIWVKRFFAPVIFCGVVSSVGFSAITGTAMSRVRRYSYRLFFVTHLVVALLVPVLLFFHARSARWYMGESLIIFIVDLAVRKSGTVTTPSILEMIPGTNLIKVSAPLPIEKAEKFRALPASHIYLSLPPQGRLSNFPASKSGIFDFLYNPFTVSSVGQDNKSITFIARKCNGPMTNILAEFASSSSPSSPDEIKIPLAIEGPYGAMGKHFQGLLTWGASRILLIAGGVGATFAVPLYHAIQHDLPAANVQFVWAIRSAGDATWAIAENSTSAASRTGLLEDPNVHLYLTGDMGLSNDAGTSSRSQGDASDGIELDSMAQNTRRARFTSEHNQKRPNIEKIIDTAFRHGVDEKVAVLVCGPEEMSKEVRRRVRPWVIKGRDVWWHNESFGF